MEKYRDSKKKAGVLKLRMGGSEKKGVSARPTPAAPPDAVMKGSGPRKKKGEKKTGGMPQQSFRNCGIVINGTGH